MMTQEAQLQKNTQVLIIDDSRSIQVFVHELLQGAGYGVSSAYDGDSGLDLINSSDPDVVLLDVEMPGMTGLQVLDHIAGKKRLFAIIMFTTRSSLDQIVEGLSKGADDYIVKPFQPEELLARVASARRSVAMKRELEHARRQADEALLRLNDAQSQLIEEKKMQAIVRLAAGVAHEINNPLGFIQSNLGTLGRYAEFLLSGINSCEKAGFFSPSDGDGPPVIDSKKMRIIRKDLFPLIQETQEGFGRIADIVRNLMRLEQGIGAGQAQQLDLNGILGGVMNCCSDFSTDRRMTLDSAPLPLHVMGVLTMLNTVFVNLVRNALEAVGAEGEILIRTGKYSDKVYGEICDSGCGIKAEDYAHIFDPFFTTKMDSNHVGLGLTIAECFVQAHGGTIEVTSFEGGGTRVRVLFPETGTTKKGY